MLLVPQALINMAKTFASCTHAAIIISSSSST
jgi:hypothetical protein